MGTKARWMTGALVSAGLMLGSVGSAQAQPGWGGGRGWDRGGWDRGWDRHHRHRGDGFGVGDAIGVAALVGAVAIVASSLSKDKQTRTDRDDDAPPPSSGTDYGADHNANAPARDEADFSDIAAQDDAQTDACAIAARDEAQGQGGGYAEVRHIDAPRTTPDGATNIDGEVESRASYRAASGTTRRFICTMKDGRVASVYLSRDVVMR
ncbi:hypothetical protein GL174_09110 [Sphingobium sp. CAP-1]|nr:hypothetical protein GL174_09110 [Sphingobium sp. CAP-1]